MPAFASREDYEIYRSLMQAGFEIEVFRLEQASSILDDVKAKNFNQSIYHLQKWISLYTHIWIMINCPDIGIIQQNIMYALSLTGASINESTSFSETEINLFIELALTYLCENKYAKAGHILNKLTYIDSTYKINDISIYSRPSVIIRGVDLLYRAVSGKDTDINEACAIFNDVADEHDYFLVFALKLAHALQLMQTGDKVAFSNKVFEVLSGAKIMGCPLYNGIVNWFTENGLLHELPLQFRHIINFNTDRYMPLNITGTDISSFKKDAIKHSYTIGNIIRDERLLHSLSLNSLSNGICSASLLSKLENGEIKPSFSLVVGLLSRMDLSRDMFTFFVK